MNSIEAAQNLHEELLNDPYIKEYQLLEKSIHNHPELKEMEEELKDLQKELVSLKSQDKDISEVMDVYLEKKELFETHPLIINYLNLKEEVNNLLIMIEERINGQL